MSEYKLKPVANDDIGKKGISEVHLNSLLLQ
jgi:hypothetical protein